MTEMGEPASGIGIGDHIHKLNATIRRQHPW